MIYYAVIFSFWCTFATALNFLCWLLFATVLECTTSYIRWPKTLKSDEEKLPRKTLNRKEKKKKENLQEEHPWREFWSRCDRTWKVGHTPAAAAEWFSCCASVGSSAPASVPSPAETAGLWTARPTLTHRWLPCPWKHRAWKLLESCLLMCRSDIINSTAKQENTISDTAITWSCHGDMKQHWELVSGQSRIQSPFSPNFDLDFMRKISDLPDPPEQNQRMAEFSIYRCFLLTSIRRVSVTPCCM